jgi:hypothetical protein
MCAFVAARAGCSAAYCRILRSISLLLASCYQEKGGTPTDGTKAPGLKFGQSRVMALLLTLTLFQHLIDGFRNWDLRQQIGVDAVELPRDTGATRHTEGLPRMLLNAMVCTRVREIQETLSSGVISQLAKCLIRNDICCAWAHRAARAA